MKLVFLGTNGWFSTKTGLTTCALVDCKECYIVLDAGEGIQHLDKYITDDKKPIYLFLSHLHLDHIYGLHIIPKFNFKQGIKIIGKPGIIESLGKICKQPFIMALEDVPYGVKVSEVPEGTHESPIKFKCKIFPHADPSMAYRFTIEGKDVCYCTDLGASEKLTEFVRDSDIMIAECSFKPNEPIDKGWPHMNPEIVSNTAKDGNVKKLLLMHFGAERYPTIKERKEAEIIAKSIFENTTATEDGMEIEL